MHQRIQFMPGEALLVLEAQQHLLEFLVSCCKLILHDISDDAMTSDVYPPQLEPALKTETEINGFSSLSILALEAPYRVPASLSLARIEKLLEAATGAKEDHIWALREDPSYFHERVVDASQHRQEVVKDVHGSTHPIFKPHREQVFWNRVLGDIVSDAYLPLEVYAELWRQVRELKGLQERYLRDIKPDKELPPEYLDALLLFQHFLSQAAKGPIEKLKRHVMAAPPFRHLFVREPPADPDSPMIAIRSNGAKRDSVEGYLIWLLQTIWEDGEDLFLLRLPAAVDELQRLIDTEEKAAAMITSYIEGIIADLAIISECLRQLDNYQPWANTFEEHLVDKKKAFMRTFAERTRVWGHMLGVTSGPGQTAIASLGNPSDKKFDYPVARKRTKENVDQMRLAEANLDAFWERIDKTMSARSGDLRRTAVGHLLSEPRILKRTPEWSPPPKSTKLDPVEELTKPLSDLYFDLERCTSQKELGTPAVVPKEKVKTRRASGAREGDASLFAQPNPSDPQPIFSVDDRALRVFRTIFFTPSPTAIPGDVAWNDFVHALVSVGVSAEKLYGSIWEFTPTALDVERSIHFHESHPGKIPYNVARRHGRRLNRAYGWHGLMFVPREKNGS